MILRVSCALLLVASACASPVAKTETIGPLTIDVPAGWQTTREGRNTIKFTDGSVAAEDSTRAGSATAVFDLYLNSTHTAGSYRKLVDNQGGRLLGESAMTVDGEPATVLDIEGESFAGRWTVVVIDTRDVLIVYRAAYPNDDEAFNDGRPHLLDAVRSIRFEEAA
jgi:hypothetical protein